MFKGYWVTMFQFRNPPWSLSDILIIWMKYYFGGNVE